MGWGKNVLKSDCKFPTATPEDLGSSLCQAGGLTSSISKDSNPFSFIQHNIEIYAQVSILWSQLSKKMALGMIAFETCLFSVCYFILDNVTVNHYEEILKAFFCIKLSGRTAPFHKQRFSPYNKGPGIQQMELPLQDPLHHPYWSLGLLQRSQIFLKPWEGEREMFFWTNHFLLYIRWFKFCSELPESCWKVYTLIK